MSSWIFHRPAVKSFPIKSVDTFQVQDRILMFSGHEEDRWRPWSSHLSVRAICETGRDTVCPKNYNSWLISAKLGKNTHYLQKLEEEGGGSKEEKLGVNIWKHHGMTAYHSLGEKKEKQKCLQEEQMNDEGSSGASEATICLPAEVRTTRHHSRRGEELPLPSSCGQVSSLRRNEQLETYCGEDVEITKRYSYKRRKLPHGKYNLI